MKDYKHFADTTKAVAAETLALSEAARERTRNLVDKSDLAVETSKLHIEEVPKVLASAFNARFGQFWADQMQDTAEAERQITGWLDLYRSGILKGLQEFLDAVTVSAHRHIAEKHLTPTSAKATGSKPNVDRDRE